MLNRYRSSSASTARRGRRRTGLPAGGCREGEDCRRRNQEANMGGYPRVQGSAAGVLRQARRPVAPWSSGEDVGDGPLALPCGEDDLVGDAVAVAVLDAHPDGPVRRRLERRQEPVLLR